MEPYEIVGDLVEGSPSPLLASDPIGSFHRESVGV